MINNIPLPCGLDSDILFQIKMYITYLLYKLIKQVVK
jgi:hypothetical protein